MKNKKKFLEIFVGLLILAGLFYYFGYQKGLTKAEPQIIYKDNPELNADFSLFWQVWNLLKHKYIEGEKLSDQELLYSAVQGLAQGTKDPYTVFLRPNQAKILNEDLKGEFGGVGIEISIKHGELTIIAPLKGTPGDKAGLKAGDKIVSINGKSTVGISLEEAVEKIRGKKGTEVILGISRKNWNEPKDFKIKRGKIAIPTLDFEMKNKNIAYIHLHNFNQKSVIKLYKTALILAFKKPKGIILDLRNNPGGYLNVAVDIASFFLDKNKIVVKEKFKDKSEQEFKSSPIGLLKDYPLVVLINKGSASASEILAGALKHNRNVPLIGEKTFGKGTVQEVKELKDNSQLKFTVAKWILPNGQEIGEGIEPTIKVENKDDKDLQLEKAMEIINEL